jgi:hypothetical protein
MNSEEMPGGAAAQILIAAKTPAHTTNRMSSSPDAR